MFDFTIVIPVYNERDNLPRLEKQLQEYLYRSSKKTCVLFVNDGSTDGSKEILEKICSVNGAFSLLSFDKNYGLSAALKAGFDNVQTDLVGYMDSDLQTIPDDFERLLPYSTSYTLVTGIRENRQDSFLKRFASNFANRFRRLFTKDGVKDTGCPLKIIQSSYAKRIPMFNGMHRFLPALILLQKGTVYQVPVRHFPRTIGKPKFGIRNRIWNPLVSCFIYLWMKRNYIHYTFEASETDDSSK